MSPPRVVQADELQLWLQFMTLGVQIHKQSAPDAALFADACLEEFHARRPAVAMTLPNK